MYLSRRLSGMFLWEKRAPTSATPVCQMKIKMNSIIFGSLINTVGLFCISVATAIASYAVFGGKFKFWRTVLLDKKGHLSS